MSSVVNNNVFLNSVSKFVEDEIDKITKKIIEEHKETIIQEIEAARVDIVAKAAVRVARQTQFEYLSDRLVITIIDRRE